jgi:signal transduction histidine kinase
LSAEYVERLQLLPREAFDQAALQTGSIMKILDIRKMPNLPNADAYTALDIRTVVRVSMLRGGQLVGVLSIFTFGETRDLTDDDETLLKGLATQAALAIANARLFDALQHEERMRAELLHRVITAQEDERIRIARELHDETSQSLTTLMLGLAAARKALSDSVQKVEEHLQMTRSVAEGMLEGIHRLIEDLRPSLLDVLGLVPAIAWWGEQRLNPLGIALHLDESGLKGRLPPIMETVLFRIVQEALTNVVRHAQATSVEVRLVHEDSNLILRVADNGLGFDLSRQAQEKSFGLRGMQERVSILGGEFQLKAAPNEGAVITVRIPVAIGEIAHA